MMEALKVMTYSKVSLPTRNWDSALFNREVSMSERVTYKRLLRQFAAIGPYLREDLCEEGRYRFDCLSV